MKEHFFPQFRQTVGRRRWIHRVALVVAFIMGFSAMAKGGPFNALKGYDATPTGLRPLYPADYVCSPLTSLYASWIDLDGSEREEAHTGVDGGRLGDPVLAPARGVVKAAWITDLGWGTEGVILIQHDRKDLNLMGDMPYYYSEFDHLSPDDVARFREGDPIERGQQLGAVSRPGGNTRNLPEVHWEVWEVEDDSNFDWQRNDLGGRYWVNPNGRLIDPLYMLSRQERPSTHLRVLIPPYIKGRDYRKFKGFTYILPCRKR
jgi:murein DD-endopeptidase MepM/ murein hydrolase activator NlpD